jgi:nicotinamidase-related amidase
MTVNYLIVIDMQIDFVTGSLGTKEAETIVTGVVDKIKNFNGEVIFTQDTHQENYLNTQEGKMLPVKHCIEGTKGWQLIPELKTLQEQGKFPVYKKDTFGSMTLAQTLWEKNQETKIASVELVGLCTDICVISNALLLKALLPELPVIVDAACCAGVTPDKQEAALQTMESCQIIIKNWIKKNEAV